MEAVFAVLYAHDIVSVAIVISLRWSPVECCIVFISAVVVCSVNYGFIDNGVDLELKHTWCWRTEHYLNDFKWSVGPQFFQSIHLAFILAVGLSSDSVSSVESRYPWALNRMHFDRLSGRLLFSAFCLIEEVVTEVTLFRFSQSFSWSETLCR